MWAMTIRLRGYRLQTIQVSLTNMRTSNDKVFKVCLPCQSPADIKPPAKSRSRPFLCCTCCRRVAASGWDGSRWHCHHGVQASPKGSLGRAHAHLASNEFLREGVEDPTREIPSIMPI